MVSPHVTHFRKSQFYSSKQLIITSPLFPSMKAWLLPMKTQRGFGNWMIESTQIVGKFLTSQQNEKISQLLPYFAPRSLHLDLLDGKHIHCCLNFHFCLWKQSGLSLTGIDERSTRLSFSMNFMLLFLL
jgi:hypothetical protein